MKIKISFQSQEELNAILERLEPLVKSCKVKDRKRGEIFNRAYLDMNTVCSYKLLEKHKIAPAQMTARLTGKDYTCNSREDKL